MKKIFSIFLFCSCFAAYSQHLISVTAVNKGGVTIDTTTFTINPYFIVKVKKGTTNQTITTKSHTNAKGFIEYVVTEKFDTIINQSNRFTPTLVKFLVSTPIAKTERDTLIQWAFPTNPIELKSVTITNQPQANTKISYQGISSNNIYYINETQTIAKNRIDSTWYISKIK